MDKTLKKLFNNNTLEATIYCNYMAFKNDLEKWREELKYARQDKSEYHIQQAKEKIKELKSNLKELNEAYFLIYGYEISE